MRRLTYENQLGESIEFYLSPFLIESLEGIGEVETNFQEQSSPYQDGSTHIDSLLSPRFIDLEGAITKLNLKQIRELRRSMIRVCNPKKGLGKITLELDGETVEIEAIANVPSLPDRGTNPFQRFSIEFKCPNPYWRSPNQTTKPLLAYKGKFTLPMTFPFEFGVAGSRTTLYNDGDVETPVRIEVHGPTTNPNIINRTTGENIKINRTISQGETMYINTEKGRQRIVIIDENNNESNAFGYLDHNSTLFYLDLLENEIEHVADSGNRHAEVIISWDSMYAGI